MIAAARTGIQASEPTGMWTCERLLKLKDILKYSIVCHILYVQNCFKPLCVFFSF